MAPDADQNDRSTRRRPTSRVDSLLRGLPHPRELIALGPHNGAHRVAFRAGIAVGVPLLLLWWMGRTDLALYTTFGAFTAFYGRSHSHLSRAKLQATVAGTLVLAVGLGSLVATSSDRNWLVVLVTAAYAGFVALVSNICAWRPGGSLFQVFAISACASIPGSLADAAIAFLLAGASAGLALLIGLAGFVRPTARSVRSTTWGIDLTAIPRRRATWTDVLRTSLLVLVAGWIPTALGLGYPYWAMVAAAASVVGFDTSTRLVRAGHRFVGTLVGVVLAAGIFALSPPPLLTILIVCGLQMCAELFVVRNYGLALVFVTPLALVMLMLAHPQDPGVLLRDRVLETFVGVAVVILWILLEHAGGMARRRRGLELG